jgi:TRAP-type C4-dicarboxylate transport system permease small subunit
MNYTLLGAILLAVSIVLFVWAVPKYAMTAHESENGETTSQGLSAFLPFVVMCLGFAGLVFVLKGLFE